NSNSLLAPSSTLHLGKQKAQLQIRPNVGQGNVLFAPQKTQATFLLPGLQQRSANPPISSDHQKQKKKKERVLTREERQQKQVDESALDELAGDILDDD
ncbi:MAG: hypothetical protein EZS28_028004, partial [Streblomastix strix]